jgi:hypothetical protein
LAGIRAPAAFDAPGLDCRSSGTLSEVPALQFSSVCCGKEKHGPFMLPVSTAARLGLFIRSERIIDVPFLSFVAQLDKFVMRSTLHGTP